MPTNRDFFSIPSRPSLKFGGHREDKENQGPPRPVAGPSGGVVMLHDDDDDDGPILYRDDDDEEIEDEGMLD